MSDKHLSAFEQEEYLLGERTAEMLRHLAHCAECQGSVTQAEQGLAQFRSAAVAWSDGYLATRSLTMPLPGKGRPSNERMAVRWALASVLPLVLLVLAWVAFHAPHLRPMRPVASISDDALLDQVDDQVSVAVPSSMESLTHLVSVENNQPAGAPVGGSEHLVQTN